MSTLDQILAECERVEQEHVRCPLGGHVHCGWCHDPFPCDAVKFARALREAMEALGEISRGASGLAAAGIVGHATVLDLCHLGARKALEHLGLAGPSAIPPEETKETA